MSRSRASHFFQFAACGEVSRMRRYLILLVAVNLIYYNSVVAAQVGVFCGVVVNMS